MSWGDWAQFWGVVGIILCGSLLLLGFAGWLIAPESDAPSIKVRRYPHHSAEIEDHFSRAFPGERRPE